MPDWHKAPWPQKNDGRQHLFMALVDEAELQGRTVLQAASDAPRDFVLIRGEVPGFVYHCGRCRVPLMVDVAPGQVVDIILRCNNCKALNVSSVGRWLDSYARRPS